MREKLGGAGRKGGSSIALLLIARELELGKNSWRDQTGLRRGRGRRRTHQTTSTRDVEHKEQATREQ